jgi:hypothetical protein
MQIKHMVLSVLSAATLFGASGFALAQQPSKPAPGMPEEGRSMGQGMMGGCQQMMGGSHGMMFKMPPGNEKLEFQMHAEMMQKMGEIAAKYASQMKEGAPGPR